MRVVNVLLLVVVFAVFSSHAFRFTSLKKTEETESLQTSCAINQIIQNKVCTTFSGSYGVTCENCALGGTVLTCQCQTMSGATITSKLDLATCNGVLTMVDNDNGQLQCCNNGMILFGGKCIDDPCEPNPCQNSGSCSSATGAAVCTCTNGFSGATCTTCSAPNIIVSGKCIPDPCNTNPCLNGGSCLGTTGSAVCTCARGFTGTTCATCASPKIVANGNCITDPCSVNPCQNGGTCAGATGAAVCTCLNGFSGQTCATCAVGNIIVSGKCILNPCNTNPCQNGGSCNGATGAAVCACLNGFSGPVCATCASPNIIVSGKCIPNPCNTNPCLNGGACVGSTGAAVCNCAPGYTGATCGTCAAGFVLYGGKCTPYSGSYSQTCNSCTLTGTVLSCSCRKMNGAMDSTSLDLVSCNGILNTLDNDDGFLQCCINGDILVKSQCIPNPCNVNPCVNGGACVGTTGAAVCNCVNGFSGSTCATCATGNVVVSGKCIPNPCNTNPCLNGGACVGTSGAAVCNCASGYTGATCATCAAGFVLYSGKCTPYSGSYSQSCSGCTFSGTTLSCVCRTMSGGSDPTSLDLNTCQGVLNTIDNDNGILQCCNNGWILSGGRCIIDPCSTGPCQNGGSCNSATGAAVCTCTNGFSGPTCATCASPNIVVNGKCITNPCNNNPCLNGGGCVGNSGVAFCNCINGFSGSNCAICASPNLLVSGKCIANPCNTNPCQNGGACVGTTGNAVCTCINGFSGATCSACGSPNSIVSGKCVANSFTCPGHTSPYYAPNYVGANDRLSTQGRTVLNENDKLISNKGRFTLIQQTDCNLVLYDAQKGRGGYDPSAASWASNTWVSGGFPGCYTTLNSDGTLTVTKGGAVVYKTSAAPFSAAQAPIIYVMQDDGNFVSYQCDSPYWATNTWTPGAGFVQITPSLNPDFEPPQFLVDGFNRKCFGDDEVSCADAANDKIGFIEF